MNEYRPGDRVEVDISAGILPGVETEPDWQPGTVERRLPNGLFRILLDAPIEDRTARKDAKPEHIRAGRGAGQ